MNLSESSRVVSVYEIFNNTDEYDENTYIGSTTNIKYRMSRHKTACKKNTSYKVYNYIREHGGWDCFSYIILEVKIVNSQSEQFELEQSHIDSSEPTLNSIKSFATPEQKKQRKREWTIENKDKIKQQQKEYNERNKEHMALKKKEYNERNKEHLALKKKEYAERNKDSIASYQRNWANENKANLKAYHKEYNKVNKQKLNAKRNVKVVCECGLTVSKSYLSSHRKRSAHTKRM